MKFFTDKTRHKLESIEYVDDPDNFIERCCKVDFDDVYSSMGDVVGRLNEEFYKKFEAAD